MSLEVDIHSAQMSILRELLFHPSAGFTSLQKPTGLDSDHFKFHIARLVELGYVAKTTDNKYSLTTLGKEYSNRLDTDNNTIEKQPKSSVIIVAVRGEGKSKQILLQQRLKQPFFGYWCRLGGKIRWGETLVQAAERELFEETGLRAATTEIRGVYHKTDRRNEDGALLEDKIFFVAVCTNLKGTLIEDFEGGKNAWLTVSEILKQPKKFEGVESDHSKYLGKDFHFEEKTHWYDADEY